MRKHAAFTLAEVLITLGIIGVVAAMTIPTLMSNTGRAEFKTAFKKILSAVSQAVTMSVALDYLDFGDATSGTTDDSIYKIISKRMQVAKTAYGTDSRDVDTMFGATANDNYTLFFADGMVISYKAGAYKCTSPNVARNSTHNCQAIVDLNGVKKPNRLSNCQASVDASSIDATNDHQIAGGTQCKDGSPDDGGNLNINDQFSVLFSNQQLIPNGYAARFVMYEQ